MGRRVILLLSLGVFEATVFACGDVLQASEPGAEDAGSEAMALDDGGGPVDAPAGGDSGEAGTTCSIQAAFTSVEAHPVVTPSPFEENGYFPLGDSGDIYFARNTNATADSTIRLVDSTVDGGAGAAAIITTPDGAPAADFRHPTFTPDGKTLFFWTILGEPERIHRTRRTSASELTFTEDPVWIALPSTGHKQRAPFVAGNELWFAAALGGTQDFDLYFAPLNEKGDVGPATKLPKNINYDTYAELHPVVSADGLALYFSTSRPGVGTLGLDDIWVSTRSDRDAPWSDPQPVPSASSNVVDHPLWLSPDNCTLVLVSTRNGLVTNHHDLFVARRTP